MNYYRDALALNGPTVDSVGINLNYIVDFWGKYRRETEAARAQLLQTEYAKSVVQLTLISSVATAYYQLREYDSQLAISQETVAADEDIVRLNTIKYKGGESAITDVYQAQVLLQQSQAQVIPSTAVDRPDRKPDQHPAGQESRSLSLAVSRWSTSLIWRKCPPACPRLCSNAARIFSQANRISLRRMPTLAWPRPPISRSFPSPASSAQRAPR